MKLVIEPYNGGLPRLRYHPYSWTKVANILFVDSPMGAGFSFSRDPNGYDVSEWFDGHPEYLANPFYVGGDSMAGRFVPFITEKISEGVAMLRYIYYPRSLLVHKNYYYCYKP
ncbi:hypothetical protein OsJ_33762 [Oryza sativa Japonica Group]|uniref:Uncharacterized protein n=1 Tax=Oryza sativa subsp. japonica TaxID=39947 RepID=B9GAI1_ORYSJ|nr:hypothetical protein OsJ_33762 [Oryza sativa Japonica Group]